MCLFFWPRTCLPFQRIVYSILQSPMAIRDTALFRPWYLPYPATRFLSITRRGISIWHQQIIPVATSEVDKFLFKSAARQGQATWNCGQIALTLATIPVPDIKETCGLTFFWTLTHSRPTCLSLQFGPFLYHHFVLVLLIMLPTVLPPRNPIDIAIGSESSVISKFTTIYAVLSLTTPTRYSRTGHST